MSSSESMNNSPDDSESMSTNIADFNIPAQMADINPNVNGSTDGKVKKTRKRVPTSCEACRKRKMKCDKKRPCSRCTLHGTISQCKYSVSPSSQFHGSNSSNSLPSLDDDGVIKNIKNGPTTITNPNSRLQFSSDFIRMKLRINKLENLLSKHNINFKDLYDDDSLISNSLNDFDNYGNNDSQMNLHILDPMIELTDKFDLLIIKENKILHGGTTSYMTLVDNDPHLFKMFRAFFAQHKAQFNIFQRQKKSKLSESDLPTDSDMNGAHGSKMLDHAICTTYKEPAAIFSTITNTSFDQAIYRINQILPSIKHIKVLIDNFFDKAYYLVPYIDEYTFRQDLEYVLYSKANKVDCFLHVNHPANTTIVSIFLIVLRFSYLTIDVKLFDETPSAIENKDIYDLLKAHVTIGPIYIEYAKLFLINRPNEYNIWKKVELNNIQALLLLRLYIAYAPEDGGENQDTSVLLGIIVQMCKILGLYRDPDRFSAVVSNPNDRIIWRRIFYKVLNLDATNALISGFPLIYGDDEWDTKLPNITKKDRDVLENFKKGNTINISPKELKRIIRENAVSQDIKLEYESTKLLRKSIKICNKINSKHKRSEFDSLIKEAEEFLKYKVNSIPGLISNKIKFDPIYTIFKIPRFKEVEIRLDMMCLLYVLNYLMFLILELEKNDKDLTDDEKETNKRLLNTYMFKTTEVSLQLFKIGYDFVTFLSENDELHGDTTFHKNMKQFYNGYEQLLESKISNGFIRCSLFVFSMFLRYHFDDFSFATLAKEFSNTSESIEVLDWLNVSMTDLETNNEVESDKQTFVLLFHYLKSYYMKAFNLKNEFFGCWRGAMLTKLFINHFKVEHPARFKDLIKSFEVNKMTLLNAGQTCDKASKDTGVTFDYYQDKRINSHVFGPISNSDPNPSPADLPSNNASYSSGLSNTRSSFGSQSTRLQGPPTHSSTSTSTSNTNTHSNSTGTNSNSNRNSINTSSTLSSISPDDSNDSPESNASSSQHLENLNTNAYHFNNMGRGVFTPQTNDIFNIDMDSEIVCPEAMARRGINANINTDTNRNVKANANANVNTNVNINSTPLPTNMLAQTPGVEPNNNQYGMNMERELLEFSTNEIDKLIYPDSSKVYDSAMLEMYSNPRMKGRQMFAFEDNLVATLYPELQNDANGGNMAGITNGEDLFSQISFTHNVDKQDSSFSYSEPQVLQATDGSIDNITGASLHDDQLPSPFNYESYTRNV